MCNGGRNKRAPGTSYSANVKEIVINYSEQSFTYERERYLILLTRYSVAYAVKS